MDAIDDFCRDHDLDRAQVESLIATHDIDRRVVEGLLTVVRTRAALDAWGAKTAFRAAVERALRDPEKPT